MGWHESTLYQYERDYDESGNKGDCFLESALNECQEISDLEDKYIYGPRFEDMGYNFDDIGSEGYHAGQAILFFRRFWQAVRATLPDVTEEQALKEFDDSPKAHWNEDQLQISIEQVEEDGLYDKT